MTDGLISPSITDGTCYLEHHAKQGLSCIPWLQQGIWWEVERISVVENWKKPLLILWWSLDQSLSDAIQIFLINCQANRRVIGWAFHGQICIIWDEWNIGQTLPMCCWEVITLLWLSDTIWWQRSGSTLAQVMACYLRAPSHYRNQCWLIISEVQWH